MRRLLTLCLAGGVLAFGMAGTAGGQVKKKKPDEPVKDKKLAGVLKDLKHKDAKTRLAALQDLQQMAEVRPSDVKPATPSVVPLLKDPDAGVRRLAILTLEALEADTTLYLTPLVEMLKKEKDAGARYAAVVALGHIGPPAKAAVPTLEAIRKAVKDNPKEKQLIAAVNTALQQINKK